MDQRRRGNHIPPSGAQRNASGQRMAPAAVSAPFSAEYEDLTKAARTGAAAGRPQPAQRPQASQRPQSAQRPQPSRQPIQGQNTRGGYPSGQNVRPQGTQNGRPQQTAPHGAQPNAKQRPQAGQPLQGRQQMQRPHSAQSQQPRPGQQPSRPAQNRRGQQPYADGYQIGAAGYMNGHGRTQQPSKKAQKPPKPQKPKLTPAQIELEKRRRAEERKQRREQRWQAFKTGTRIFFQRLGILVLVYVILMAICLGVNTVDLLSHGMGGRLRYSLQYGGDKDRGRMQGTLINREVDGRTVAYLSMTELAARYGWKLTGEQGELRYVITYTDQNGEISYESVRFQSGEAEAYVNGNRVWLVAPVIFDGYDNVYVPINFFEMYVEGIDYRRDGARILFVRQQVADVAGNLSEEEKYLPITFRLKEAATSPSMDENAFVRDFIMGELDH